MYKRAGKLSHLGTPLDLVGPSRGASLPKTPRPVRPRKTAQKAKTSKPKRPRSHRKKTKRKKKSASGLRATTYRRHRMSPAVVERLQAIFGQRARADHR